MSNTIYYVYAYLRVNDSDTASAGTPYYIGYGKNRRAFNKHHKIPVPKDKSNIVFLYENISEQEAKELEKQEISKYGRKDKGTGILLNLTDGGEGVSGLIHSEETRDIMSQKKIGEKNSFFGKTHSEETKNKMSLTKKGKPAKGNFTGKIHSEETKKRLSEAYHSQPEEIKNKFIRSASGTKWFHNPETSEVIRINPSQDPTPSNFIPGRGFKINK